MESLPSQESRRKAAASQLSRALVLERNGHHAQAADAYSEAVRLDPGDPEIQARLGLVLRELGRDDEANRAFLSALRLRDGFVLGGR